MTCRILLISYYWPPAGGGGVHRWLKFTRYLPEFGITPVIYTPLDPDYPAIDNSLMAEVDPHLEIWRYPIWEPYHVYRRFVGLHKNKKIYSGFISENRKETLRQKISVFIRGNFFIPDARKFWIRPSVRFLHDRLQHEDIDLIISTGPPHSMHRIAYHLRRTLDIPWIADFRDPWTGIDFYDKLRLTSWGDRHHRRLEKEVLTTADRVVTVSPQWKKDLENISGREVQMITNGYDEQDFSGSVPVTGDFTLTHLGSVNPDRNAPLFWDILDEMLEKHPMVAQRFKLRLIGPVDQAVTDHIMSLPGLSRHLEITEWLDHTEAILEMRQAKVLLLLLNNTFNRFGILPGKLFEYLATGRPVLCIGPAEGDTATILKECRAGEIADYEDAGGMRKMIGTYFSLYEQEHAFPESDPSVIARYARRNLVGQYAQIITETVERARSRTTHQQTRTSK